MARLRATRIRVEMILLFADALSAVLILLGSMRSDAVPASWLPSFIEKPLW